MRNFYCRKAFLMLILLFTATLIKSQNKITNFPYLESFESGYGDWIQSTNDQIDWTRQTGETPSFDTGPGGALDGSYYIFTEASGYNNMEAYLEASFDLSLLSNPALTFYYHMFGSDMGSLHIDVWDGTWNFNVFTITGQQQSGLSDPWKQAQLDLSDYQGIDSIVVRLRGITGDSFHSDICIDKIEVFEGPEMTVNKATIAQPISDSVFTGIENQFIGLIEIETQGITNSLTIDSLYLNTAETDNFSNDVSNVKIYYTYNDSTFKTNNFIAGSNNLSNPIYLNNNLKTGNNYFWITYDLEKEARTGNYIDVGIDSITFQNAENLTTINQISNTKRKIEKAPEYYTFMPANLVVGQPDFYSQNSTLDEYTGPGSNNSAVSSKGVLAVGSQSVGRILIWNSIPDTNGAPADVVLGNPDFNSNTDGTTNKLMTNVEGVCFTPDGKKLIASDGSNNRVLIWNSIPDTNGAPADVVIGQEDFTSSSSGVGPNKLSYPAGVIVTSDGKLLINDYQNSRVLVYNQVPTTNGASADLVIGQEEFYSNTPGTGPDKINATWYSDVSIDGKLIISDLNNNRVLIYNEFPTENGEDADVVIGQSDFNTSSSGVTERTMYMPVGVTVSPSGKLAIAEFGNNRVLIYNEIPDTNNAPADYVLGQPDFYSNTAFNGGVNEKSMRAPYGINFDLNGRLYVNGRDMHRVMVYGDLPEDTADIKIDISSDKTNPHIGENISYSFTLSNNGPNGASEIVVKSSMPGLFKLTNYTVGKGEYKPYGGTWNIPFVASGESVELTLEGTIKDGGGNITAYSNIVSSSAVDTNMENNATSLDINVVNDPPTISEFTQDTIVQGTSTGWIQFTISDPDTDIGNLEVEAVSSDGTVIPDGSIEIKGEGEIRYLRATPFTTEYGSVNLTVTVSDGFNESQSVYELYILCSNANLFDLKVDGTTITGFSPDSLHYVVELPDGTTEVPDVYAVPENFDAQVNITDAASIPGVTTVEVLAEDGETAQTYTVTFDYAVNADNDARLKELQVDGATIEGFSPITYQYTKTLPYGTTVVPSVTAIPNNDLATVTIDQTTSLPGTDSILVTATDGVTEQYYEIEYIIESPSDNNNLESITIDGEEMVNFDPDLLSYTIIYPYGTTTVPVVTATTEDPAATINKTDASSMPGTTTLEVTAEDGSVKTYSIEFTLAPASTDAKLADLDINGTTVFGFSPDVYTYDVELENDVTEVPVVTAEANHDSATVSITDATEIPGTTSVVVTAQDGTTELTYEINFSYKPLSSVSLLSDLKVSGVTVANFEPETYSYMAKVPEGTTVAPNISATVYDNKATKSIENAPQIPGTSVITVTAEDGSTSEYSVYFTFDNLSSDASLSDLQYDGTSISGFNPDNLAYSVELPYGTSEVPTVTATTNDANASKSITDAADLPGTTKVEVTAEDEYTTKTYEVNFTVTAPAEDATLKDLQVNGATVSGFDPATLAYDVELANGTSTVPTVTANANDDNATVEINDATALPGTTSIVVTAEDGSTTKTYEVNFSLAPSTDATLSDLKVDGTTISGFDPATLTYNVELSAGTTTIPTVTATANDANASVNITNASSLPGTTNVVVTAEDETTSETYEVAFTVATAINSLSEDDNIELYPNPTKGLINIAFDYAVKSKVKVEVFNSIGNIMLTEELKGNNKSNFEVNLTGLPKGIYFIKISINGNLAVKNVIIH